MLQYKQWVEVPSIPFLRDSIWLNLILVGGGFVSVVRIREVRNREDNNLGSIKMQILSFQGKNDPEA